MGNDRQEEKLHEGGLLALEVRPVGPRVWLGPAWAALCGAVASGGFELEWQMLLMVLLAVVLADPVLGSVWALASRVGAWSFPEAKRDNPGEHSPMPALPYTLPGSVGDRLLSSVAHMSWRWQGIIWPRAGSTILGIGFLSLVAVLLAASLGRGALLVTVVALGVGVGATLQSRSTSVLHPALAACFLAGLPWLIGYAALGGSGVEKEGLGAWLQVLVWPALYATTWYAYRWMGDRQPYGGALLLGIAHLLAVGALVVVRQPIMAGVVALLLLPQLLLQPELLRHGDGLWYVRRGQGFAMGAMTAMSIAVAL
jgi:hypothetical protein